MEKIKLFCFPYAGSSAQTYLSWKKYFRDSIELCPVELAGRGKRMGDPFYDSIDLAVDDVLVKLRDRIKNGPYALYGHSMGTILGYELARRIRINHLPEPIHAFFSGRFPPLNHCKTQDHLLPDAEFIRCIGEFGNIGAEMLKNRELMALFLPIIRADFRMVELYRPPADGFKLDCPLTLINGAADPNAKREEVQGWEAFTSKGCTFYEYPGGHFFINEFKAEIAQIINQTLRPEDE